MSLTVNVWTFDELPEALGVEKDDRFTLYLVVRHDGDVIAIHDTIMAPEDVSFERSLDWVAPLLRQVYELGVGDGRRQMGEEL